MLKEEQTQTNQKAWISTLPTFSCLIVFKRLFHFRKVLFFYFLLFLLYIIIHQFYLCIKTQASLWQKLYEHNKASFVLKHTHWNGSYAPFVCHGDFIIEVQNRSCLIFSINLRTYPINFKNFLAGFCQQNKCIQCLWK